jgi:hypothetical protein
LAKLLWVELGIYALMMFTMYESNIFDMECGFPAASLITTMLFNVVTASFLYISNAMYYYTWVVLITNYVIRYWSVVSVYFIQTPECNQTIFSNTTLDPEELIGVKALTESMLYISTSIVIAATVGAIVAIGVYTVQTSCEVVTHSGSDAYNKNLSQTRAEVRKLDGEKRKVENDLAEALNREKRYLQIIDAHEASLRSVPYAGENEEVKEDDKV